MAEVTTVERVREFLKPWEGRCLVCGWTLGTSCTAALCRYVGRDREQQVTLPASLLAELVVERERLAASFDQYIAGEMAKSQARAEQAEHSLAASERALAALRYQAQAGGCELSTVGENSYHCRTDALCGLCRLRHRASQAERSLATLRELIHTASGLDDHRYSAEQMVKEMAERWQGASDDCEKAEQALATVTAERDERHEQAQRAGHAMAVALTERDEARAELAAWHNIARSVGFAHEPYTGPVVVDAAARGAFADWCERNKEAVDGRAAAVDRLKYERDALQAKLAEAERENLTLRNRIGIDRTSWHEAEAEVKVLRAKLAKTERERDDAMTLAEERRDYARAQNAKLSVACDDLRAQLTAAERVRDEARAERDSFIQGEQDVRARATKLAKVVEAARVLAQKYAGHSASCVVVGPPGGKATILREPTAESCTCRPDAKAFYGALRALDSPVGAGTDSGGASGAATPEGGHAAPTGGPMPPPEPAGIIPYVIGPPLRFDSRGAFDDDDSPVGVAAAPESNEGLIPSGACRPDPPPDYLTRAELVSAVRSAASAVGGPPRRALDALADALEIPHT